MVMALALVLAITAIAADEVLVLKRDLAREKSTRIQTELVLMQQQYREAQTELKTVQQELEGYNKSLKEAAQKEVKPSASKN